MSYEPDTSHPRFARPTLVPPFCTIHFCLFLFLSSPVLSLSLSFFCSRPLIHRDTVLFVLLVASLVDVGPYNNNNNVNPSRLSSARSTSSYWHISVLSFFLLFSLALHLNHSRSKIAAVDEEASGREWRDFAHCAAIIPVTRDTLRTPG